MCLEKILTAVQNHKLLIADLKKWAPLYPKYYKHYCIEYDIECVYLTTMVRIFRDGKWYKVHIVESIAFNSHLERALHLEFAIRWMNTSAYRTIYLYQLGGLLDAELDEDQTPETERILKDLQ